MTAPTLARDADGWVALTAEQAAALARGIPLHPDGADADTLAVNTAVIDAGDIPVRALARWVRLWAPVVEAAIAQRDAHVTVPDDYSGEWIDDREWIEACSATEVAVRAALGEKAKVPA